MPDAHGPLRLPPRKLGALRGAAWGAMLGLSAAAFLAADPASPPSPPELFLALAVVLGPYGGLVGGGLLALRHAVGKARVTGPDLRGADLSKGTFRQANLAGADLRGANLAGADLSGADLAWARLGGADLTGANLAGADLRAADVRDAELSGADLTGALLPDGTTCGYRPPVLPRWRLVVALLLVVGLVSLPVLVLGASRLSAGATCVVLLACYFMVLPPLVLVYHVLSRRLLEWCGRGCPNCGGRLPDGVTKSRRQRRVGGWTCAACGEEFDWLGRRKGGAEEEGP
jgi:hypothetical protein